MSIQKDKQEVAEKVAARAFAKSYMQNLIPDVLDTLATNGYFYEKIEKELESQFLPWLNGEVEKSLKKYQTARALADGEFHVYIIHPFLHSFFFRNYRCH